MPQELWTTVDRYIVEQLIACDSALDSAISDSNASGLPTINVTPSLGKLLHLLAKLQRAKHILEIGTLGRYSTIWLARALAPGGGLITLEVDAKHTEVARANIARAGLTNAVQIRLGPALETLPRLAAEGQGPFDFVFIDADKENCASYFEWAIKLSRPGGLIVVDNVIRDGNVVDPNSADPRVQGVRRLFEMLTNEPRVEATALQTVGAKGYDGLLLAVVSTAAK